jgi:hypothetical protein
MKNAAPSLKAARSNHSGRFKKGVLWQTEKARLAFRKYPIGKICSTRVQIQSVIVTLFEKAADK